MEFTYNFDKKNTINCNFNSNELNYNYNLELSEYWKKFSEEVDSVIVELTNCTNKDNFSKVKFGYNNQLVIKNGNFYFGNSFKVNLTSENKEMFIKFLEYMKPHICVKNEEKISELLKLESSMFPICKTFTISDPKENVLLNKTHIFDKRDCLRNIDCIMTSSGGNCDYSLEELKIMKKYMESDHTQLCNTYNKYINCITFSLHHWRNDLEYDNSGSVIFSGIDDNVRVKNFIKCLDFLIEEKTK